MYKLGFQTIGGKTFLRRTDVATNVDFQPGHFGENDFYDPKDGSTRQLDAFMVANNELVLLSQKYAIDFGTAYARFYEFGIRWSQQLPGPIKERTQRQYDAARNQLVEQVTSHVTNRVAAKRAEKIAFVRRRAPALNRILDIVQQPVPLDTTVAKMDLSLRLDQHIKRYEDPLPYIDNVAAEFQLEYAKLMIPGVFCPGKQVHTETLEFVVATIHEYPQFGKQYLRLVEQEAVEADADEFAREVAENLHIPEAQSYLDTLSAIMDLPIHPIVRANAQPFALPLAKKFNGKAADVIRNAPTKSTKESKHEVIIMNSIISQQKEYFLSLLKK